MLAELINNTHTTFFLFCFSFFAELVKRALHSHPHAVAVCCHQGAVSEILKKSSLWSAFTFVLLLVL